MKPSVLKNKLTATTPVVVNNLSMFDTATGNSIGDSTLSKDDLKTVINKVPTLEDHVADTTIHITEAERNKWNEKVEARYHLLNGDIHVSEEDRLNWDSKETEAGSQAKANKVQSNLNSHANDTDVHITPNERLRWDDTYTKSEISAMFTQVLSNLDWKESVETYEDLFTMYPEPYDGWTVNVLDTNITYRFDGDNWIAISGNAIPMVTEEVAGLMSPAQCEKLNDIEEMANHYVHPNDVNTRHVTDAQIALWTAKASTTEATYTVHGLMSIEDKKKLDNIEEYATHYEEPDSWPADMIEQDENHRFVTDTERNTWNAKANNVVATQYINGLMAAHDKYRLDNIEDNANRYVHPVTHNPDIIAETSNKRFVSDIEKTKWNSKFGPDNVIRGSGIFNGITGTMIEHDLNDPSLSYSVMVTPTSMNNYDAIGQIIVIKEATQCFIRATGGNNVDTFDYFIFTD